MPAARDNQDSPQGPLASDPPRDQQAGRLRRKVEGWNFFCNTADGALALFGFSIVSADYLLSPFLRRAGASDDVIGLLAAIVTVVTAPIPLVAAQFVRRLRRKKPYVTLLGVFQRLHLLTLAALAIFVLPISPVWFFVAYVASAIVQSAATQAVMPAWTDLVAKVTPYHRRGALWAWRFNIPYVAVVLFGFASKHMLNTPMGLWDLGAFNWVWNYSLVFIIAWAAFGLSLLFVALIREHTGPAAPAAAEGDGPPGLMAALHLVPRLLRSDRPFAWFLAAQAVTMVAAGMVGSFLSLTAQDRFGVRPEDVVGAYMSASFITLILGNIVFARLGDRLGHRLNLLISAPAMAAACVWAVLAPDWVSFGAVYVLIGLANSARGISNLLIVMEFAGPNDRTEHMAVHSTISGPMMALGPFVGGLLRVNVGLAPTFLVAACMGLLGAWILLRKAPDPRRRVAPPAAEPAAIMGSESQRPGAT